MAAKDRWRAVFWITALVALFVVPPVLAAESTVEYERRYLTRDGLLRADVLHHETRRLVTAGVADSALPLLQKMVPLLMDPKPQPHLVRNNLRRAAQSVEPTVKSLVRFTLGLIELMEGNWAKAIRLFDKAAWGLGSVPVARLNLAHLALQLGRPKAALEVLGAGPIPPMYGYLSLARYHTARAEALLGNIPAALNNLQAAFFDLSGRLKKMLPVPPDYLLRDPMLNNLRTNNEFKQFVFYVLRLSGKK